MLIYYKFIDKDLNLEYKGKVAQKFVSLNKIILTELLFSGLLKELTCEECVAIFSCLGHEKVTGKNAVECNTIYSDSFKKAKNFIL